MSTHAHKVMDALLGRGDMELHLPLALTPVEKGTLMALVDKSEKFKFTSVPLEDMGDGYAVPRLSNDEKAMFNMGLLPLPAPYCWFEFKGSRDGNVVVLIVSGKDGDWLVDRVDVLDKRVTYVPISTLIKRKPDGDIEFQVYYPDQLHARRNDPDFKEQIEGRHAAAASLTMYLVLMLHSRTTERVLTVPPPKLVKAQARRDRTPMHSHHVVTIAPARYASRGEGTGTHSSPRLHWRRSHLRHFDHQTPGAKWMSEREHNGQRGWWVVAVPRTLIGKAELGSVSHEYRVL